MHERVVLVSLLSAGALLAVGCDDDNKVAPKPLSSFELCALHMAAQKNVSAGERCTVPVLKDARDLTSAEIERGCRPGTQARMWADGLLTAVTERRLSVNWDGARACLEQARALRRGPGVGVVATSEWKTLADGACKSFFSGLVKEGQPCSSQWDCAVGLGCFTDDSWAQGEVKTGVCLKPSGKGETCSGTHPCNADTRCVMEAGKATGKCDDKLDAGQPCKAEGDCKSDSCAGADEGGPKTCGAMPLRKKLGESCGASQDCEGADEDCVACRSAVQGAPRTCRALGGVGEFCLSYYDCAYDLGCMNGKCAYAGKDEACIPTRSSTLIFPQNEALQARCSPELACLPTGECSQTVTQMDCQSHGERCVWKEGKCLHTSGVCLALPTTGACYLGQLCDDKSTYCDEGSCMPHAKLGESCAVDGKNNALCLGCDPLSGSCADLWCIDGTCQHACALSQDCDAGKYCGPGPTGQPTCLTTGSQCHFDRECGPGRYCSLPQADCGNYTLLLGGSGYDAVLCLLTPGCNWVEGLGCTSLEDGACAAVQTAGGPCDPLGTMTQCPSRVCSPDDKGVGRCEVDVGQIGDNGFVPEMIMKVFQFG